MQLEEDGVLDVDDEVQMYVLHRIFLPRLNWHLQMFRNGWNNHPISTENNFSPNQLMLKHMLPAEQDIFPVEIQVNVFMLFTTTIRTNNTSMWSVCTLESELQR
jgi:hypothetical protein